MSPSPFSLSLLVSIAAGLGCGNRDHDGDRAATTTHPRTVLEQRGQGQEVVAEVNGQPIFAGCVATQMTTTGADAAAALDQCIDFELLAQAAAEAGYADHPEVRETRKVETVRAVIDREFSARFDGPEDVPERDLREHWKRWKNRLYDYEEWRFAEYARATFYADPKAKNAPVGSPEDVAAHTLAKEIYAAVRDRHDLTADQLRQIATETAAGRPLSTSHKPFDFPKRGRAVPEFADAAFAIPKVGMVSPPTRTKWGWDVILLTRVEPARHQTYQQALPKMRERVFEMSRRRAFLEWSHALAGGRAEVDLAWLERLTQAERAQAEMLAPEPAP